MPSLAVEVLQVKSMLTLAHIGLIVGPTIVVLGMILFAVIVFGATRPSRTATA